MFWTEIGNVVKIERAGMDGSERRVVVNSSLGWPGGVTVDTASDRVYWTDERLKSIGSATLDGGDVRVKPLSPAAVLVTETKRWPESVPCFSDPAGQRDGEPVFSRCVQ